MSTASKVTLLSTILATGGIVAFVHWAQTAEKAVRMNSSTITPIPDSRPHPLAFVLTLLCVVLGNARRSGQGYGATTSQTGAAGRL
jgi:hypothetical protein